jgi:hypothetical protein
LILTTLPIGCGKTVSSPCPAPPIPTWSADDSVSLALEMRRARRDGAYPQMLRAVEEYYAIREQIRACDR